MDLDNLQTFHNLFSQWRFTVPNYQRGYAWGEDQWKAMMEDLSTLTDDNDHFTGLLVLHENKDPAVRTKTRGIIKDVYDIVDGQQRMTTVIILLNEIRRSMQQLNCGDLPGIANSIVDTYLYEPGPGGMPVLKMNLDRLNHDFFARNVLEVDGKDLQGAEIQSHKNLINARTYFRDYLQKKQETLGEGYAAWLETLYGKISNQMKVMVYRLRSEADAGVVFESMNNRGKKPNHLDLVKNYLLFLASKLGEELNHKLTAEINKTWEIIFKQLSIAGRPDDEETLLQMHWFTVYDHDRKHWDVAKEKSDLIKKRFSLVNYLDRYDQLFQELLDYIRTLSNAAIAYCDLRKPTRPDAFQIYATAPAQRAEIIRYSEKLLRLNILRTFQPLLIAARLTAPENAEQYLLVVKLCERYAFRVFTIAERRTSGKEAVLFRLANQFYHGQISLASLDETIRRDILNECSDTLFKNSFSTENPTPWYGKRGLHYFLYEYEEELFKPEEPIINWQTIYEGGQKSIEHILPQNPPESGYWAERFTLEERQRFKDQVGNLTLILSNWNSSLGNRPFPEKKGVQGQEAPSYANSDLKITNRLVAFSEWTPEEIRQRQERLAEWALQRWQVPAPPPLPLAGWERQLEIARRNGVEREFLAIREVALKLGLGESPGKNCMIYKPTYNWTLSAITVYTYQSSLSIIIRPNNFTRRPGLTKERIAQAFNNQEYWSVNTSQFPAFLKRFEGLLGEGEQIEFVPSEPTAESPRETRANTWEAKIAEAEKLGVRIELEAIHAAARRLKMRTTIRKGIQYRSPYNYRTSTMVVYLYPNAIGINLWHENFMHYGLTWEEVENVLQLNRGWNWFPRERAHLVVEALERFYERVQSKTTPSIQKI